MIRYFIDKPTTGALKGKFVTFEGWCVNTDWKDPIIAVDLVLGNIRGRALSTWRQDVKSHFEEKPPMDCGFKAILPLETGNAKLKILAHTQNGKTLTAECNTIYKCQFEEQTWNFSSADNCQILAPLVWSRQASPANGLFVAIINYKLNQRAIQYRQYLENVPGITVQVINSCDSKEDEIDGAVNLGNEGYTGCWNAVVELFQASPHDTCMLLTSDVTIDTPEVFDALAHRQVSVFKDINAWAYTCDIHYSYYKYDINKLRPYGCDSHLYQIPIYDGMFVVLARELVSLIGKISTKLNRIGWVQEVYASILAEQHKKIFVKDYAHRLRHSPSRGYASDQGAMQEMQFAAAYHLTDYFAKKATHNQLLVHSRPRKTILFLNHNESRTGAPKVLLELIYRFIERNKDSWETYVFSATRREDETTWLALNAITPEDIPQSTSFLKMRAILEQISPDVIYANSFGTLEYAYYAKLLRPGMKIILHVHEFIPDLATLLLFEQRIAKIISENCVLVCKSPLSVIDQFITVCHKTAETLQEWGAESILKSHPIVNFQEIEKKLQDVPPICFPKGVKPVVTVGDAIYRKGFDRFLDLAKNNTDLLFVWLGRHVIIEGRAILPVWDAGHKVYPKASYTLPENVVYFDNRPNPFVIMKQAHASLILSREDPLPCAAIEMKFLGVPLLTIKESGDSHLLTEEEHDIVLEKYDPEEASRGLRKLVQIPKLSELNYSLKSKWSPESIYDHIEKIIVH